MTATVWQMREIARRVVTADRRRWMWRIVMSLVVFSLINTLSQTAIKGIFSATGASDIEMHVQHVRQLKAQGVTPAPLDASSALHILGASALLYMVVFIISGAGQVAVSRVSLRAVRDVKSEWAKGMFVGFKDPLGMLSLGILMALAIGAGLLLFVIPGFVILYGLRQSWYFKADHPEWSAVKCMSASWRKMQGRKLSLFVLDLSFLPLFIAAGASVVLTVLLAVFVMRTGVPMIGECMVFAAFVAAIAFGLYLSAFWYAAKAVFYCLLEK